MIYVYFLSRKAIHFLEAENRKYFSKDIRSSFVGKEDGALH